MLKRIFLLQLLGSRMLGMSLDSIATIVSVIAAASDICFQKISFSSIVTPKYVSESTATIWWPAMSTLRGFREFLCLVISTISVFWCARFSSWHVCHVSILLDASSTLSLASSAFLTVMMASRSAIKPTGRVSSGMSDLSRPSYRIMQGPGPRTDPCATPSVILEDRIPSVVTYCSCLLLR